MAGLRDARLELGAGLGDTVAAESAQAESDLPGPAFAYLWVLRGHGVADAKAKAEEVRALLDAHPTWPYSGKVERAVRLALFKALKDDVSGGAARLVEAVGNLLKMHRTVLG